MFNKFILLAVLLSVVGCAKEVSDFNYLKPSTNSNVTSNAMANSCEERDQDILEQNCWGDHYPVVSNKALLPSGYTLQIYRKSSNPLIKYAVLRYQGVNSPEGTKPKVWEIFGVTRTDHFPGPSGDRPHWFYQAQYPEENPSASFFAKIYPQEGVSCYKAKFGIDGHTDKITGCCQPVMNVE